MVFTDFKKRGFSKNREGTYTCRLSCCLIMLSWLVLFFWPAEVFGQQENTPQKFIISPSIKKLNPATSTTAWNKYRQLRKYTDLEKYPPSESVLVTLAEHKIESVHRPYIEIVINEVPWKKINFQITVTMELKGFVLKIQGGKIKEIRTGKLKGTGKIKCEEMVLLEKETESVDLPGTIGLGEGIPIG